MVMACMWGMRGGKCPQGFDIRKALEGYGERPEKGMMGRKARSLVIQER